MKAHDKIGVIFFLICLVSIISCNSNQNLIIGEWTGAWKERPVTFIFDKTNHLKVGSKSGFNDYYYRIDFSKTPIELKVYYDENSFKDEKLNLTGTIKFITDDKLEVWTEDDHAFFEDGYPYILDRK